MRLTSETHASAIAGRVAMAERAGLSTGEAGWAVEVELGRANVGKEMFQVKGFQPGKEMRNSKDI